MIPLQGRRNDTFTVHVLEINKLFEGMDEYMVGSYL